MLNKLMAKNLLPAVAIVVSLVSLALVFYLINKQAKTPEVAGTSLVNLDVFDDKIASISAEQTDLQEQQKDLLSQIGLLKTENNKLKTNAEACKKFVQAFFLFYEKASEMFANGISGCAIKYLNSGNPNQLPDGCYRWESWKVKSGWDKYYEKWQQEPDQKYYDSLKDLYGNMTKYQASCQ